MSKRNSAEECRHWLGGFRHQLSMPDSVSPSVTKLKICEARAESLKGSAEIDA